MSAQTASLSANGDLINWPLIIQGGMGVAVSNWVLARTVSQAGQLGVVSGTAVNSVLVRRLQMGDPGGHMRRALDAFPFRDASLRVLKDYFVEGGINETAPFKRAPLFSIRPPKALLELNVISNFAEVWLSKEGHGGVVGINFLEKIQMPNLSGILGAMLAGVDYVLMGAGIPREIPGALDAFSKYETARLRVPVEGATATEEFWSEINPLELFPEIKNVPLKRPKFLAIIASHVLASSLAKKATGYVDGFVVEGPTAGGHNAPPRGGTKLNDRGEPIYGDRDLVDLEYMKSIGRPFWLAGGFGTRERLAEALNWGAQGIQVGTAFAFCKESGMSTKIKQTLLKQLRETKDPNSLVFTDPRSSPTGFPFKAIHLDSSVSVQTVYESRPRICDLGYLRHAYRKTDGSAGYRCPAEPVKDFLAKGGALEETVGRKCLCNSLFANVDQAQKQASGFEELPLVTAGDDYLGLMRYIQASEDYSANDVINDLLGTDGLLESQVVPSRSKKSSNGGHPGKISGIESFQQV
ncbi:MAG: nitronate monooxygenase [Bdellovibrionales bacterium]|nr:nitronate monooxygenase [Bdellovibrionales bacterium]